MDKEGIIRVVTYEDVEEEDYDIQYDEGDTPLKSSKSAMNKIEEDLDVNILSKNLKIFIHNISKVFTSSELEESPYYMDEIELNLNVNASGGIEFVGSLKAGMEAGIKVKLRCKKA